MAKLDPALLAKLPREYLEENIGERLIIVAVVFIVLQTVFVSLYYSSRYVNKTLNGWECWLFMPIGYLFTTVLCVCGICKISKSQNTRRSSNNLQVIVKIGGAGRHVEAVLIEDPTGGIVMTRSKIDKAVELIYLPSITCSKFVILCLYMRIFNTGRRYQLATYFIGSIVLLNWLAAFILSFSICRPLAAHWDHSIPGGKCGNIISAYQFISVPNIASDLMILMLPIPALYKLHVDLGTKIGLFATFLTGSVQVASFPQIVVKPSNDSIAASSPQYSDSLPSCMHPNSSKTLPTSASQHLHIPSPKRALILWQHACQRYALSSAISLETAASARR
jgi:hypothetical protein